jgi:hypothetical protein
MNRSAHITRREFLRVGTAAVASVALIANGEKPVGKPGAARKHRSKPGEVNMEIKRVGSQPSANGPAEYFTGTVRVDPLFQAPDPAFVSGASVTFAPGARTAWHTDEQYRKG